MISTNSIKPKVDDTPHRLRHLVHTQAPARTGAFNFDQKSYPNAVRRIPNRPGGGLFTDQLRSIQEAKEREARLAEVKRQKAVREKKLAAAAAARKALAKRTPKKVKSLKKAKSGSR